MKQIKTYIQPQMELVQADVAHLFSLSGLVGNDLIDSGGNASDNGNPELHVKAAWTDIWDELF